MMKSAKVGDTLFIDNRYFVIFEKKWRNGTSTGMCPGLRLIK